MGQPPSAAPAALTRAHGRRRRRGDARWRNDRAWLGALAAVGAVCLEPLARVSAGDTIRFRTVWVAEVAVGLAMVVYVASEALAAQTRARRGTT